MSVHPSSPLGFQPYGLGQQAVPAPKESVSLATETKDWFAEGVSYELGSARKINLEEAFKCYEEASKRNDTDALVRLAFFRAHGIGCEVDPFESEKLAPFKNCQNRVTQGMSNPCHF